MLQTLTNIWDSNNKKFNSFTINANSFLNLNKNDVVTETLTKLEFVNITDSGIIDNCTIGTVSNNNAVLTITPSINITKDIPNKSDSSNTNITKYNSTIKLNATLSINTTDSNKKTTTTSEVRSYYLKLILEPVLDDSTYTLYVTSYTNILNLSGTWNVNGYFNTFDIDTDSFLNLDYANETLKSLSVTSISNSGIISDTSVASNYSTITFTPTENVSTSGIKYSVLIKIAAEITKDDTTSTKYYFLKLILEPSINNNDYKLKVTHYEGKLNPASYVTEKAKDKDNLNSLVTKKALIANLSELANQVGNKVGNTQVFALRYDLNGGVWEKGNEGRTSFVNSIAYSAPKPIRLGYYFTGWKTYPINTTNYSSTKTINTTNTSDDIGSSVTIPVGTAQDVVAVAQWSAYNYHIICNNADGTSCYTPWIKYGANAKLGDKASGLYSNNPNTSDAAITESIDNPTKAGYTFSEWSTTNKFNQTIYYKNTDSLDTLYNQIFDAINDDNKKNSIGDITLTPVFEPKIFSLAYDLNGEGGSLTDSSNTTTTYTYDTTMTLPIPTRPGWKFDGWNISYKTSASATTSNVLSNQFVLNPGELSNVYDTNITLTAQWSEVTYHLDFDTQGGIMSSDENDWSLVANASYTITNPTKDGYTFNGWTIVGNDNNNKLGTISNDNATYKYNAPVNINQDVTLRASWTAGKSNVTVEVWTETVDSTGTYTSETNDSCTYEMTSSKTISINTDTILASYITKNTYSASDRTNVTCPDGFEFSKISTNEKAYANGTGYIKIYFHRATKTLTIKDNVNAVGTTSNSTSYYRTDLNKIGTTTSTNNIPCKYGQTITVGAVYNSSINPSAGFTADSAYQTITIGINNSNNILTFTYSRRKFNVTYKTNGICTFNSYIGDEYSIEKEYYESLGSSSPNITNYNNISSSKWSINGTQIDDTNLSKYNISSDTIIERTGSYKTYTVTLSSTGLDETTTDAKNDELTGLGIDSSNKFDGSKLPYTLPVLSRDAYNFIGWNYKTADTDTYSSNYIREITLNTVSSSTKIYLQAVFERKTPELDLISASYSYSPNKLTITSSSSIFKNGANIVYLSTKDIEFGNKGISSTVGIKAEFNNTTISSGDNIILTAGKAITDDTSDNDKDKNIILGKSYIATIKSIDTSNSTVTINDLTEVPNVTSTNNKASDTATTATKLGNNNVGSFKKPIYLNSGTATAISGNIGSTTQPVYINSDGEITAGSTYAGGTAVTLNGTKKVADTASFYAPTDAGEAGWVLKSNGSGAPTWLGVDENVSSTSNNLITSKAVSKELANKLDSTAPAASAKQLANSITIQTNLASTSAISFNGASNITPGVTGTLGTANGGTGANLSLDTNKAGYYLAVNSAGNALELVQPKSSDDYFIAIETASSTQSNKGTGTSYSCIGVTISFYKKDGLSLVTENSTADIKILGKTNLYYSESGGDSFSGTLTSDNNITNLTKKSLTSGIYTFYLYTQRASANINTIISIEIQYNKLSYYRFKEITVPVSINSTSTS